jgi:hypothetical protein
MGKGAPEMAPKAKEHGTTNKFKKHFTYDNKMKIFNVFCHYQQSINP